jgi:hypothetical protein
MHKRTILSSAPPGNKKTTLNQTRTPKCIILLQVQSYLRFAKGKREENVREVDLAFSDVVRRVYKSNAVDDP